MLTVYGVDQSEKWDEIVKSFSDYDVYYLSGYVKAFQLHGDGEPLLLYYEGGNTRGINVVMKRDVADDKHFQGKLFKGELFDIVTPYGYGGWLVEGEQTDDLFVEYSTWAHENKIVSEFVRFHPVLKNHSQCTAYYDVVELGNVVTMYLDSPEVIWQNIISKNRNVIRKADKNGVEIKFGRTEELFRTFRLMYDKTMDKDSAEKYYYFEKSFYDSVRNDLTDNSFIVYAEYQGKIISSAIVIFANEHINYHLSGSLREYSSLAASNLMLYKVALWGCENGYHTFYLGGGVGSGEDNLFKFKRAFYRGDLSNFYIGKKIFDNVTYDKLVQLRESVPDSNFFPLYRA